MKLRMLGLAIVGLAASALQGCIGCENIGPGHVGVTIHKCSGGGVDDHPVGVGYQFTGPCTDIEEYPVFQQTLILTKAVTEGSQTDDSITVTSSEGLPISVDVSLSFTLNESQVPGIYKKFRTDIEHIEHSYMKQAMREALQETFAKYTAQQLYSDKKEIARAEVQGLLLKKFAPDGFNVMQFTINETRVPPAVTAAISAKVAMTQEAQQAEQEVRKKQAIASQTLVAAEAEAKAVRLHADAESYANEKLTKSMTPALVEYMKVQKWDGKLSQVSGGSSMISLSK